MNALRKSFLFFSFAFFASFLMAQTPISGQVNSWVPVIAVDCVPNTVTVDLAQKVIGANGADYAVGDLVLIIQITGAEINETNSASFGDITDIRDAGNYEYARISNIAGNVYTLQFQMLRTYDPVNGAVQLVRIPEYAAADVTAPVDCIPWDGRKGGVTAFDVAGRLRMFSLVRARYNGFQGMGKLSANSCACNSNYPDYFYPGVAQSRGAPKGQGVAEFINNKEAGRGKQGNGGGGGNDHNAGGGGGANYGAGGQGGIRINLPWCNSCGGANPGLGGTGLAPYYTAAQNKIFFGGAGGSGHDNNGSGFGGGRGGGIVIIRADELVGNNQKLDAFGERPFPGGGDGTGGGGAGGCVLLDVNTFTGSVRPDVRSYGGGDHNWSGANNQNCMGTGGGGAGGVVWIKQNSTPAELGAAILTGGPNGVQTGSWCNGQTGGATPGATGVILHDLVIPESNVAPNNCVLPVQISTFEARQNEKHVDLFWETQFEVSNDHFVVQRSETGRSFVSLRQVPGKGNSNVPSTYKVTDADPIFGRSYYRLKQVDYDGTARYSDVVEIYYEPQNQIVQTIFPNPSKEGEGFTVSLFFEANQKAEIQVVDMLGRVVHAERKEFGIGKTHLQIPTDNWSQGMYLVKVATRSHAEVHRVVVK